MKETENQDKVIICSDCGEKFVFSVGESQFYQSKGFDPPKRCRYCRQLLRQKRKALESERREVQRG